MRYINRLFTYLLTLGHFGDDLPSQSFDWCKTANYLAN